MRKTDNNFVYLNRRVKSYFTVIVNINKTRSMGAAINFPNKQLIHVAKLNCQSILN